MRTFTQLTFLTLGAAALAGIAGLAAAAVIDPGSAVVVAVVVALGVLLIGLLEWSHRRGSGLDHAVHGADLGARVDRDHLKNRDTLRPSLGWPAWSASFANSGTALLSGGPTAPHRS